MNVATKNNWTWRQRRLTQDVAVRLLTHNRTEMKVVVCSGLIKVTEDAGWVS